MLVLVLVLVPCVYALGCAYALRLPISNSLLLNKLELLLLVQFRISALAPQACLVAGSCRCLVCQRQVNAVAIDSSRKKQHSRASKPSAMRLDQAQSSDQ